MFRSKLANSILVFCAAAAMTGCAGAVLSGPGVSALLAVTPSSIQFGDVPVGTELSQAIQVTAKGKHRVTIESIAIRGRSFTVSGAKLPVTLSPGESISLTAAYRPSAAGNNIGGISVRTGVPGADVSIPVAGSGVKAKIALTATPGSLAFGPVNQGAAKTQTLSLKSTGNAAAEISRVSILGTEFKLTQNGDGVILKPGQVLDLAVTFSPTRNGTANGMLNVASNAGPTPLNVPLGGVGAAAGSHRSVSLRWAASSSAGVIGYNVYRSDSANGVFTKVNAAVDASTNYKDSSASSGSTYFYVVTAVDSQHVESAFSTPASVKLP